MNHIYNTCVKIFHLFFFVQVIQRTAIITTANVILAKATPRDFHLVAPIVNKDGKKLLEQILKLKYSEKNIN